MHDVFYVAKLKICPNYRACFYLDCEARKCYTFGIPANAPEDTEKCEDKVVPWFLFDKISKGPIIPACSGWHVDAELVLMAKPIPKWLKSKFLESFKI